MKQKFVTEALGGKWHEDDPVKEDFCTCGNDIMNTGYCPNLDLTTPDGMHWVVGMLKERNEWNRLCFGLLYGSNAQKPEIIPEIIIFPSKFVGEPELFLNAVATFLGYEEE